MSNNKENGLELKVGLFIVVGLAVIFAMVIRFGLGGSQGFKKYYDLQLDLPNANGLLKGSDVLLAGARVGYVGSKPVLSKNLGSVRVTVNIEEDTKIPRDSAFKVDSSGLLGDKFVAITTPQNFDADKFNPNDDKQAYKPGELIQGTHTGDLMETVTPVVKKLSDGIDQLQTVVQKLNTGILSDDNMGNIHETLANLKTTSDNFSESSKKLTPVFDSAKEAVDNAKQTMVTANAAAADLRNTIQSAKDLLQKAGKGDGLIATLLTDRQLSENLKALVLNLREHGVLFYHNTNAGEQGSPQASPAPARGKKQR